MFAIAIYDKEANKLVLIRDRSGVKPLFYYHKNNCLLFASELKSFHEAECFEKQIDRNALALYLQYGYVPQPYTIFQNTHKLEAGYYLEVDLETKETLTIKYWDVIDHYNKPKLKISDEEAIDETEKLLKSSFEYRMVADVPVGMFLSGGYDSSVVTAMLQHNRTDKINTFTIGFHEKGFDEAPYAKEVAKLLGTNHTEYYCTQKDALEIIPKLPEIYDEPFGDSSGIPTTLVSALARKDVTVSLSADGGDEIFAGYSKHHRSLKLHEMFSKMPNVMKQVLGSGMDMIDPAYIPFLNKTYNFETRYKKIRSCLPTKSAAEIMEYTSQHFTLKQVQEIMKQPIENLKTHFDDTVSGTNDEINHMLAIDYKTYMVDDILTKVDRAGMSVSLEGREPLLDYRLIEFVAQLPSHLKYREGHKKWLLKEITHKYLPKKLMDRPKQGFGVPITEWFRDELRDYFLEYLDSKRLEKEGFFKTDVIIDMRDKYLNGDKENVQRLWFILMFEMWYEKWMI
jgi:asparagine synthase (glutamine-hydrolysing)